MQMNMVRKGRLVLVILPAIICAVMRPAFARNFVRFIKTLKKEVVQIGLFGT